jgi:esterase
MPLPLAVIEQGDGPPVVILHGVFGSARNWSTIAKHLAAKHRVLAIDLRNHGDSPHAPSMTYAEMAADVLALIEARRLDAPALIGHSMGGKVAMLAALLHPELIARLVVVDVAPVTYRATLRAYAEAMAAVKLEGRARRAEVDGQLAAAIPEPGIRAFLLQNLVSEPGGFRWRLNLDAIIRAMDEISSFPELDGVYTGPTLFIRGERSNYVTAAHTGRIRALFPRAKIVTVAGAGHWVHAEQPGPFLAAIEAFLA